MAEQAIAVRERQIFEGQRNVSHAALQAARSIVCASTLLTMGDPNGARMWINDAGYQMYFVQDAREFAVLEGALRAVGEQARANGLTVTDAN